LVKLS